MWLPFHNNCVSKAEHFRITMPANKTNHQAGQYQSINNIVPSWKGMASSTVKLETVPVEQQTPYFIWYLLELAVLDQYTGHPSQQRIRRCLQVLKHMRWFQTLRCVQHFLKTIALYDTVWLIWNKSFAVIADKTLLGAWRNSKRKDELN